MCNNTTAQRFKLVPEVVKEKTIEDGEYIINSSKDENKVINLKDGKTSNNTNVNIYQNNNVGSQKWIITYQKNGYYTIKSKLNKNKCLDIAGANFISVLTFKYMIVIILMLKCGLLQKILMILIV